MVGAWPGDNAYVNHLAAAHPYLSFDGALYAIFNGIHAFVPHFSAEGLMLLYARGFSPRRLWLRFQLAWMERGSKRKAKHLRVVDKDKDGEDEPPQYLN